MIEELLDAEVVSVTKGKVHELIISANENAQNALDEYFLSARVDSNKLELLEELGNLIFKARLYDGRSRIEVAEIIGISPNTLKMYEEGKRMVPANVLLMLNQIYGTKIDLKTSFPLDPLKLQ